MLNSIILSLLLTITTIFSLLKFTKGKKNIFIGLYFGSIWALLNLFVHSEAPFIEQLKTALLLSLSLFAVSTFFFTITEGYFKALIKLNDVKLPDVEENKK